MKDSSAASFRASTHRSLVGAAAAAFCAFAAAPLAAQPGRPSPFDLSLEELGTVRVQTASRRAETLNAVPAAVYVITEEEIRRSGATSIPEALRLAPGVEVARNGAHEWTISIRGFNNELSNKLLVLINGRSVYSPLYAGVFWDAQDTLIADVERIEVVAGPGGAIWGANAVNGVVNVITHSASDTLGTFAEVGVGNELETHVAVRHGWQSSESRYSRVFVKHFKRDATEMAGGGPGADAWDMLRAGYALEWEGETDRVNLRVEAYDSEQDAVVRGDFTLGTLPEEFPGQVAISGYHTLVGWYRPLGGDANLRAQLYVDHTKRDIPGSFAESRDTVSASLQHDLRRHGRHDVLYGIDLRTTRDALDNTLFARFMPERRSDDTASAFLNDDIAFLDERVVLTLGAKFESNDYTGFETQPSARVAWRLDRRSTVWGGVSRAARIPSRLESDLELLAPMSAPQWGFPLLYVNVRGNPEFLSEQLTSYEAGYRFMPSTTLAFDLALFDNYYDRLLTTEIDAFEIVPGPPEYALMTGHIDNLMKGETYGGTVAVNWQARPHWRLQLHYSRIELDLELKPGGRDANGLRVAGNSPRHQYAARAFAELAHGVSLYAGFRHVDELPSLGVPSYLALDLNAAWQITRDLRTSLTVTNANDARHVEFGGGRAIERAALVRVTWRR